MKGDARVRAALRCEAIGPALTPHGGTIIESLVDTPRARLLIRSAPLDLRGIIGQEAVIDLGFSGEKTRSFPLQIWSAAYVGAFGPQLVYELDLRDPLAWLSLRSSHRSWVGLDAKAILQKILSYAGIPSSRVAFALTRPPSVRAFEAQYGETDLDVLWRLLEEEGIFLLTDDEGKLTFSDDTAAGKPFEGDGSFPLGDSLHENGLYEASITHRLVPDAICVRDEDRAKPGVDLTARARSADAPLGELFSFPGGFQTQAEGAALAKVRLEEQIARSCRLTAKSARTTLAPGTTFALSGSPNAVQDKEYFVLSVEHRLWSGKEAPYQNTVIAQPASLPYRPERIRRRPTVSGIHCGEVTTQQAKVHTEEMGRATVRLHWDETAKNDQTSSSWVPVLQPLVASGVFLARSGWDVGVRYLDGRLDRPIVAGRLYLGRDAMPVALPADKTVSSYATRTDDGGAKRNGFRIDDKSDAPLFTVEAGKDYDALVEHDVTETIMGADALSVGERLVVVIDGKETRTITGDSSLTVKIDAGLSVAKDVSEENGGARTLSVKGGVASQVQGDDTQKNGKKRAEISKEHAVETTSGDYALTVHGDAKAIIDGPCATYVDGAATEKGSAAASRVAGGAFTLSVGGNAEVAYKGPAQEDIDGDLLITSQDALTLEAGLSTWQATGKLQMKADKLTIEGTTAITIMAGGGIVSLAPSGVTIVGTLSAEASGNLEIVGAVHLVG